MDGEWLLAAGGQACLWASMRVRLGLGVSEARGARRASMHRASDTFRWPSHRGGLLDWHGTRDATIRGGEPGEPNLACFTPKDARRVGAVDFLLGAARRGVAF